MLSLPLPRTGSQPDTGNPDRQAAMQRRVLAALVLLVVLALSVLAFSLWEGLRSDRRQLEQLSGYTASLAAERLARRLAETERVLDERLRTHRERLATVLSEADGDADVLLRSLLPEPAAAHAQPRAEVAPAAANRSDTPVTGRLGLVSDRGQPWLTYRATVAAGDGSARDLQLLLPCGEVCTDAGAAPVPGLRVYLAGNGGRWDLAPAEDEGAPLPASASLPQALLQGPVPAALPAASDTGVPGDRIGLVGFPVPGLTGWRIEAAPDAVPLGVRQRNRLLATVALSGLALLAAFSLGGWVRRQGDQAARQQGHLNTNRRRLAAVLGSTTEGIIQTEADGTIELFNPAAEVMFGQLGEDVIGGNLDALLPELADAGALQDLVGAATADIPIMRDLQARRADGGRFPARVWLRHLSLDDGLRLLLVVQDLTEATQNVQQLTYLEQRDVLTGLLNRKEFARRMQRHLAEAAGSETPHVLCYIDIDQFKVINDTVGHTAGDALVEQLATLIEVRLDDAALLARLGGDEFGALFVDCSEADALDRCEGLMQTIRNFLFTWRDRSFDIAVSIGLTAFQPENDSAAAELAKADVACHMAKHDGRDRIHVYRDGDTSVIRHHGNMHLVSTISQALSSGRFRLYTQPIMPLGGVAGGPLHYEVLVRMLDEHGDAIRPDQFIPAAEQYILMPAVDRWIIHELFSRQAELLRSWQAAHSGEFLFAVNLSGTSVTDDSFLPYLRRQFEVHRVPPAAICFEITETAAMRDLETARAFMQALTDMGASFALDDFGSGLSSYNYLRELPVGYLKIDGSFVHDMNVNPVNHALVASINQVAHVLGLKTIAEWAEDTSTINQLRALNVDFVQGFAIGVPLPLSELQVVLPDPHEEPATT